MPGIERQSSKSQISGGPGSTVGDRFDLSAPAAAEIVELASTLTIEEHNLLFGHAEEAPFCGVFVTHREEGVYTCKLCGLPLFTASAKFDSGTGWPSFTAPFLDRHLSYVRDVRFGTVRTEIACARCGTYHGHVFDDGPPPTGRRYCINSGSLELTPRGEPLPDKLGRGAPEGGLWAE